MNKLIFSFVNNKKWVAAFSVLSAILMVMPAANAIKKCQDAEGKWHYGDVAACRNAKVTTLDGRGFIKDEKAAPKSKEEREAEEKALAEELAIQQAEQNRKEAIEQEHTRILGVYETEADIDRQRDNQLYSVDSNIAVHKAYLDSMHEIVKREEGKLATQNKPHLIKISKDRLADAQNNIKDYTEKMALLEKQREDIMEKFKQEKELYRKIKQAE